MYLRSVLRDVPPVPGASALTILAFAAGVICGVIVAKALQPVRVVRFYSVPLPADAAGDMCDLPAVPARESIQ